MARGVPPPRVRRHFAGAICCVGVSGLADWIQEDLFALEGHEDEPEETPEVDAALVRRRTGWAPGMDVEHTVAAAWLAGDK